MPTLSCWHPILPQCDQGKQGEHAVTSNDYQKRCVYGEQSFDGKGTEHHSEEDEVDNFRTDVLYRNHSRAEFQEAIRFSMLNGMTTLVRGHCGGEALASIENIMAKMTVFVAGL